MLSTSSLLSLLALLALVTATTPTEGRQGRNPRGSLEERGFYSGDLDHTLRSLKAANRRSDVLKRDDGLTLTDSLSLSYVENENQFGVYGNQKTYRAEIEAEGRYPVLLLERFDQHLTVSCFNDVVSLKFNSERTLLEALETLRQDDIVGASVITSHRGCNEKNERAVFKIEGISEPERNGINLRVSKRSFKDAFKRLSVDHGFSDEPYIFRENQHALMEHLKRDEPPEPSCTWDFCTRPAPVPTGTPSNVNGSVDLSWESHEQWKLPYVVIDHLRAMCTVGCNHCQQTGTATFSQGKFDVDFDVDWSEFDVNPIKSGWLELDVTDYSVLMDMWMLPTGVALWSFPIPTIPFPGAGFVIQGFGKIGAYFEPDVSAVVTLNGPLLFNYGFRASMPDSTIKVDLANLEDGSYMDGWTDGQIEALPFSANDSQASLTLSLSFMPRVALGLSFLMDENDEANTGFKVESAVFANFPSLDLVFTPGCPGMGNSTDLMVRDPGELIAVQPMLTINGGFEVQLKANIEGINPGFLKRVTLASTSWTMPTTCYSVDFEQATWSRLGTVAAAMAAPTPTEGSTSSAPSKRGRTAPTAAVNGFRHV